MKCHYEVLTLPRDASSEDIKKARDKLARQYHPDKAYHLSDPVLIEEFTATFKLIQQAYEVLSDPHERAWYDSHRDQILYSKEAAAQDVEIFPYFNSSCYAGFGDDEGGFFEVYRKVFQEISLLDVRFAKEANEELEVPSFGKSTDAYDEVVNPFYGYWQSYSTKRPFYNLDKWDLRQADNRRISRAMEKENKKARDTAKKEWNESIRELANFVRKRDPRVKAYRKLLEEKAEENQKKAKTLQEQQRKQRQELIASHKHDAGDFEKAYRELERNLGGKSDDEDEVEEIEVEDDEIVVEDDDPLYCISCEKRFKSFPAMRNHIKSNMHKKNMEVMRDHLLRDEVDAENLAEEMEKVDLEGKGDHEEEELGEPSEDEMVSAKSRKRNKKKKTGKTVSVDSDEEDEQPEPEDPEPDANPTSDEKPTEKAKPRRRAKKNKEPLKDEDPTAAPETLSEKVQKPLKGEKTERAPKPSKSEPTKKVQKAAQSEPVEVQKASKIEQAGKVPKPLKSVPAHAKASEQERVLPVHEDSRDVDLEEHVILADEPVKDDEEEEEYQSRNKAKKDKKAKQVDQKVKELGLKCGVCKEKFDTRNKLFQHIKESGHAVFK